MKKIIQLWPEDVYETMDGSAKTYIHDANLCEVLGQAKAIILFVNILDKTTTAKASFKLWESAKPGQRPSELDVQLGSTIEKTSTGASVSTVSSSFSGLVEVTMDIVDTETTSSQKMRLEVWATLILEE